MRDRYVLALACDLNPSGTDIGPKTKMRLKVALTFATATNHRIVVAAGYSPRFPNQPKSMAQMMNDWLVLSGYKDAIVLEAKLFNTRGEIEEFFSLPDARAITSAPWHLRRLKVQLVSDYDLVTCRSLQFVPVHENTMSAKEKFILEPLKLGFEVVTFKWSRSARDWLWHKVVRTCGLLGVNLSY